MAAPMIAPTARPATILPVSLPARTSVGAATEASANAPAMRVVVNLLNRDLFLSVTAVVSGAVRSLAVAVAQIVLPHALLMTVREGIALAIGRISPAIAPVITVLVTVAGPIMIPVAIPGARGAIAAMIAVPVMAAGVAVADKRRGRAESRRARKSREGAGRLCSASSEGHAEGENEDLAEHGVSFQDCVAAWCWHRARSPGRRSCPEGCARPEETGNSAPMISDNAVCQGHFASRDIE